MTVGDRLTVNMALTRQAIEDAGFDLVTFAWRTLVERIEKHPETVPAPPDAWLQEWFYFRWEASPFVGRALRRVPPGELPWEGLELRLEVPVVGP